MPIAVSTEIQNLIARRQEQKLQCINSRVNTGEPIGIPTRAGQSRCLLYRPTGADGSREQKFPLFVDIHGGGFTNGFAETDDPFCRKVCERLNIYVISVDYRLAPEFPFPCGLEDVYDVVTYLASSACSLPIDKGRIAVGGHSAGGNLAASLCLIAAKTGTLSLRCQILDYPPVDMFSVHPERFAPGDPLTPELAAAFNTCYRLPEQAMDYLCSPIFAPDDLLAKVPPAILLTAGLDSLREDGEAYGLRLAQNGVPVTMKRFPNAAHGFTIDAFHDPQAQEGHAMMIEGLRQYL